MHIICLGFCLFEVDEHVKFQCRLFDYIIRVGGSKSYEMLALAKVGLRYLLL